jgi:cysteine desulfurase/selenocysteine lyase
MRPAQPSAPATALPPPQLGDRSLFPALEARAYLAHAAMTPPCAPVQAAVQRYLADIGRAGAAAFGRWQAEREALRSDLAGLIGADAAEIALVQNTSAGVIAIAQCFPWQPGDRVLVFDGDFPANVTPWQRAAAQYGLELIKVPFADLGRADGPDWQRVDDALQRSVRMVAVSAVQFQTGLRVPLPALSVRCQRAGARLFVDGIQACGAVPLDVRTAGIDYLSCGGHKWLMGLEGSGFLYIAGPRLCELKPILAGWLSHAGAVDFLVEGPGHLRYDRPIRSQADFLEVGTPSTASLAGLHAGVSLLGALTPARVFDHVGAYLDKLEPALVARGFRSLRTADSERRSCILSLRPPPDLEATALQRMLLARGVVGSVPDGFLRFSPHWPNALDEIPDVLAAIDEVCVKLRS